MKSEALVTVAKKKKKKKKSISKIPTSELRNKRKKKYSKKLQQVGG